MALRAAAPLRTAATPLGVRMPSAAASQSSGSSGSGGAGAYTSATGSAQECAEGPARASSTEGQDTRAAVAERLLRAAATTLVFYAIASQ